MERPLNMHFIFHLVFLLDRVLRGNELILDELFIAGLKSKLLIGLRFWPGPVGCWRIKRGLPLNGKLICLLSKITEFFYIDPNIFLRRFLRVEFVLHRAVVITRPFRIVGSFKEALVVPSVGIEDASRCLVHHQAFGWLDVHELRCGRSNFERCAPTCRFPRLLRISLVFRSQSLHLPGNIAAVAQALFLRLFLI